MVKEPSLALRLDDVGAASKRHEVYGATRLRVGSLRVPFPGNFLFLKRLRGIRRWGPYRELSAGEWTSILSALEASGSRMTVAVTAGWVESSGQVIPYPQKFPEQAGVLREGVARGLLEVANHGYTHCVLEDGLFRPRLFSSNRRYHREFHDWLPEALHREHLARAQAILGDAFGALPATFVPPGNVFSRTTVAAAAEVGLRFVCCRDAARWGPVDGVTYVDDAEVVAMHDRDVVVGGLARLTDRLAAQRPPFVTVADVGRRIQGA